MLDLFKQKRLSSNTITLLAVLIGYIVICVLVYGNLAGSQLKNMVISISCYIVMAVSLNLVVGLLGELSLGHAGFMSVGLFSGCFFSVAMADSLPMIVRLPLSMIVGGLAAALVGFIVGLPALRLRGDYLAIVTLGCGEIIKNILTNLNIPGTAMKGALGLETKTVYSTPAKLLPYAIILVLITILVMMNFKKSKHGRAVMAIRDNRIAAEATGINVTYYKLLVFMIAAFFAGAAGVLFGHSLPLFKAATFDYNMSIEILVIVVLGGMGNIGGSIIAAIILRALPEAMRGFDDYRMLLYSVVLIAIMLLGENKTFQAWKSQFSFKKLARKLLKKEQPVAASAEAEAEAEAAEDTEDKEAE